MQTLKDLQEKLFFECKSILHGLSKISTQEELLVKQDLLTELNERITVLKYLEKNSDFFEEDQKIEIQHPYEEDSSAEEFVSQNDDEVEEEVIFNNELNEINEPDAGNEVNESIENETITPEFQPKDEGEVEKEEEYPQEETPSPEVILELNTSEPEIFDETSDEETQFIENEEVKHSGEENEYEHIVSEKENETEEEGALSDELNTVAETHISELFQFDLPPKEESVEEESHTERKFKLAHIKGLKEVPSLFEEIKENEKPPQETPEVQTKVEEPGSLQKTNVSLNFMEAEKARPEFRLDLNDKIAFSKILFGGSQAELNEAIRDLNSFKTLEDAKEYLSDLYYTKNWSKVDEYAQRLWTLVETKFL